MNACPACGAPIPTRTSFEPRPDGMYDVRQVTDQQALRAHLLQDHRPADRRLAAAR